MGRKDFSFRDLQVSTSKFFDHARRLSLHIATGALSVVVHYGVMAIVIKLTDQPVLASGVGFAGGALTRFFTAYYGVFAPAGTVRDTIPKFCVALGVQAALNLFLLSSFIAAGMNTWWSQVTTTGLLTLLNYAVYRAWVFR